MVKAREAYARIIEATQRDVVPMIEGKLKSERDKKSPDDVRIKSLLADRVALEQENRIPNWVALRFKNRLTDSRKALIACLKGLHAAYLRADLDAKAEKVKQELSDLIALDTTQVKYLATLKPNSHKQLQNLYSLDGTILGKKIILNGQQSHYGIFAHPFENDFSEVVFELDGTWTRFATVIAIPSTAIAEGSKLGSPLVFEIIGDGKTLWKSNPVEDFDTPQSCEISIAGVRFLNLRAHCTGGGPILLTLFGSSRRIAK